jgi:hypothetical protein
MKLKSTLKELAFVAFANPYYYVKQDLDDTRILMSKIEDPDYRMNNYDIRLRQKFEDYYKALKKSHHFDEELLDKFFSPFYKKLLPHERHLAS